jgi:hypothetical protein
MLTAGKPKNQQLTIRAFNEVECTKIIFFSASAARQEIFVEEEGHLNQSILLLSESLRYCRFSDNNVFTLTTNLISQANFSPILKELE